MNDEVRITLALIQERIQESGCQSVFILMKDFPWFNERNGQLTRLYNRGLITKPRFYDDGVELRLTEEGREYLESENNKNTEREKLTSRPSVFISYNWGSDDIADELQIKLKPFADVKRDKTSVRPWGNLPEFMDSIREQDFAVLIISDAYLRSDACLYEVLQLMKESDWDKKVMYIVTEDTHIYKATEQFDYIDYWERECVNLREKLSMYDPAITTDLAAELKKCESIKLSIGEFMAKVKSTSNPKKDKAIDLVVSRVEESSPAVLDSITIIADDEQEDRIINTADSSNNLKHNRDQGQLREGWNFHDDIALRLEMKARQLYGDSDRPYTKIYDADSIEGGCYAEVMINLLRMKSGYENSNEVIDLFVKKCAGYIGKSGYEIEPSKSQELLNEFLELFDAIECENKSFCETNDEEEDFSWYNEEDIWIDGYHEVRDREGNIAEKGQYRKGKLVDGICFNVILKVSKKREKPLKIDIDPDVYDGEEIYALEERQEEEPIKIGDLKQVDWCYTEFGKYDVPFVLLGYSHYMKALGLEYFYIVDKKVKLEGKLIKPTFTNFRPFESVMAEREPDELEYLKTGIRKYDETDSADIEVDV